MPENARVIIVEDEPDWQELAADFITDAGHSVVGSALNIDAARLLIHAIAKGEIEADVVVLDGNLTRRSDGTEAHIVCETIQQTGALLKVVGFSGSPMSDYDLTVDADVTKRYPERLGQAITDL